MADVARSSFNSQLASVMESLLAAAVCEISRIFEGSLSASQAEVQRGREEVALLHRKLEALEGRLQEASSGATFDPSSFAQAPGAGAGVPLLLPDLLPHGGDSPLRGGRGQPSEVKEDQEVAEMELVTFSLDRAVVSMAIKEEEQDTEPLCEELLAPGATGTGGLKAEGAVLSPRPSSLQSPELLLDLLVGREHGPVQLGFPSDRIGSLGTLQRSGGPAPPVGSSGPEAGHASATVGGSGFLPSPDTLDDITAPYHRPPPQLLPQGGSEVTVPTAWPDGERVGSDSQFGARGGAAGAVPQGPPGEKPYPCPRCSKAFISPSHLSVHVRVHTGERPYCCAQCGKSFAHNGNLRAHQRQVHLGRRPYPCAECGKRFSKRGNLRTHLQQVHLGRRPYPCVHCRKAYFSLRDLRAHQANHQGAP